MLTLFINFGCVKKNSNELRLIHRVPSFAGFAWPASVWVAHCRLVENIGTAAHQIPNLKG